MNHLAQETNGVLFIIIIIGSVGLGCRCAGLLLPGIAQSPVAERCDAHVLKSRAQGSFMRDVVSTVL
jgi:hypothetical protein